MLRLLITAYGKTTDYSKYVDWTGIQITEQINIPSQMTFVLTPSDARFTTPLRMAYVSLFSTVQQKSLFSGFITDTPVRTYQGLSGATPPDAGGQLFAYSITCTSDEYLLNCKAVPFIPAFVNRYQGDILTQLANILCPGYYDTSLIMQGDLVPFYQYEPTQTWCEIAKSFADGSRYRYKARDKQLWYQPYGDQPLGIAYAESYKAQGTFNPKALQTTVLSVPDLNDLTIIGQTEAGNNREDYSIGDGFTGNYALLHQVFRGSSTNLVQESWNNSQLNTQQWFVLDPGDNFSYNAGALNVVNTLSQPFTSGESYLSMNNGIELAGGTDVQVGECIFSDYSDGILGGLYSDTSFTDGSLIAGFGISSMGTIVTSASGAAGVQMVPTLGGQLLGNPVTSEINHSYVLQILVTAPVFVRYDQTFRTLDGETFGGVQAATFGSITWNIQDYDIAAATGIFYNPTVTSFSVDNVPLPPFAVMALVNNHRLNVSIVNTTVAVMPLGGLSALVGPSGLMSPTGLILPMLPPGSGGFIGVASDVTGAASGNILLPPGLLGTTPQVLVLGNGYDLQAAQITQGQSSDTLAFYTQSLPAAGTPIRFQSWQSRAAVSRLQVTGDIMDQAALVGDDGIRSAIVANLNPLPRTSEDCDNAALAFLQDRAGTSYHGTYVATNVAGASFFNGTTSDQQYWPTVGRFLNVDAPRRGIVQQKFFVTQLTWGILEAKEEFIQWQITFGADLILEKVLNNFVDLAPVNVLTPTDTAVPPIPFLTQNVTNTYLLDLSLTRIPLGAIGPTSVTVQVLDQWTGLIEVRTLDTNWGRSQIGVITAAQLDAQGGLSSGSVGQVVGWNDLYAQLTGILGPPQSVLFPSDPPNSLYTAAQYITALNAHGLNSGTNVDRTLIGLFQGPVFSLVRTQYDQVWYMRPVTQPNNAFGVITSRRSKVLRVAWPMQPAVPILVSQLNTQLQFNFNGDQRNIYGFELRVTVTALTPGFPQNIGDQIVLVQKPVASYADMTIDLLQTDFPALTQAINPVWMLEAYFFNTAWIYSQALVVEALAGNTNGSAIYPVPVVAGTATPDCSQQDNVLYLYAAICLMDANGNLYVNVATPINPPGTAGNNNNWQLTIQQALETPWNTASYSTGAYVSFNGINYVSLGPTTNNEPDTSPGQWQPLAGYSVKFVSSYAISFATASTGSKPGTQSIVDLKTSSSGATTPTGTLTDQPI